PPPPLPLLTLSLHDALPICALNLFGSMIQKGNNTGTAGLRAAREKRMMLALLRGFALTPVVSPLSIATVVVLAKMPSLVWSDLRSEEHTSELQSRFDLVCRL